MASEFQLPERFLQSLRALFPSLDWSRIHFYHGMKPGYSLGRQTGLTLPAGISRIHIYFRAEPNLESTGFRLLCVHELVHALQIQQSWFGGAGIGIFNHFIYRYLSHFFASFTSGPRHTMESEAYEYETILRNCRYQFDAESNSTPPPKTETLRDTYGAGLFASGKDNSTGHVLSALFWGILGLVLGFLAGHTMSAWSCAIAAAGSEFLWGFPSKLVLVPFLATVTILDIILTILEVGTRSHFAREL